MPCNRGGRRGFTGLGARLLSRSKYSIQIQKREEFAMHLRTYLITGTALVLSAAVGFSANKPAPPRGPLTSSLTQPWPAGLQRKQPNYPPVLSPAQELKTFHMPPGYQVQLV